LITEVRQRPFDAMDALLDGHLRQPDEHRFRQPVRGVHFDFDGQGVDADESVGGKFGEHGWGSINAGPREGNRLLGAFLKTPNVDDANSCMVRVHAVNHAKRREESYVPVIRPGFTLLRRIAGQLYVDRISSSGNRLSYLRRGIRPDFGEVIQCRLQP
jgi:hypothetical protein